MTHWLKQLAIAIDQLLNALCGGWADETLSSYAWRKQDWRHKAIDALFFWQEGHCQRAWMSEMERRHLPPSMRDQSNA